MENITTRRKKEYSNYIFKNSEFLWVCLLVLHTEISGQPRPQGTKLFSGKLLLIQVYLTIASDRVCMFIPGIKRSRIRYIQEKLTGGMVPVQIKDSEVPGSLVSLGEQWLRAGICFALTMGNLPSKLCSRYRVGIICHSQEPMTLAVKTFLPCLPCTLAPSVNLQTYLLLRSGWGICSICTHFHKPGTSSPGREKRTKKIAERSARKRVEEVQQRSGGKRSHSPLQTLQFPDRLLSIFSPVRTKR